MWIICVNARSDAALRRVQVCFVNQLKGIFMKKLFLILVACFAFATAAFAGQVNLNTASESELDALKGVGPVKAKAIMDYRAKNGPFKSVDDLEKVTGFGKKTVDKLRADLTVSGGAAPSKVEGKAKPVADAKKGAAAPTKSDDKAAKKDDSKKAADKK
jgi:competence protein ComEA